MEQLPYELFLRTIAGLSVRDVLSRCSTNRQAWHYCQSPHFWQDLFYISFGVFLPSGTKQHYIAMQDIMSTELGTIPSDYPLESRDYLDRVPEVIQIMQQKEYNALHRGDPLLYWTINPQYYDQISVRPTWRLVEGIFFISRTLEGAVLRLHNFLQKHQINLIAIHMDEIAPDDNESNDIVAETLAEYYDPESKHITEPYFVSLPKVVIV